MFVKGRVDADRSQARDLVAGMVLSEGLAAQLAPLERDDELAELRALRDPAAIAAQIPDDLCDQLTATGDAEHVLASLRAVAAAGVDSVVFVPVGPDPSDQLALLAEEIAPRFRQ